MEFITLRVWLIMAYSCDVIINLSFDIKLKISRPLEQLTFLKEIRFHELVALLSY
jgi:hypothetical protein